MFQIQLWFVLNTAIYSYLDIFFTCHLTSTHFLHTTLFIPQHTILILYYPSYVVCLNHLFNISFHSSSYSLHIQAQHKKSKILIQGRLGLGISLLSTCIRYTSLAVFHLLSDSLRRQSHPPIISVVIRTKLYLLSIYIPYLILLYDYIVRYYTLCQR